ncbi:MULTISPECIES: LUD domain-containing protein [Acidianus]|uniref:(Fe-S)-binding protein n=1 Tax=Candidatus Acidianus copahuensis TaxID=1160895 RepID=A0A031LQD4_9CREN|nr:MULTISPECIES: lactate utilization protein B [Acidianus]EZQ09965.1 (Fe-S)-binding protein [Candidatus Acidianus copahuensis]NON62189.1 lactate utilization protein [Acidianus sp. RZ1]
MSWDQAVERAMKNSIPRVYSILEEHPYLSDLAKRLRDKKKEVINNLEEYVEKTLESVKKNGGTGYLASTPEEVREIVYKIVGSGKRVILGKSMVAYECGVRKFLQEKGNEVWETDLGEFLIQLRDDPPSHIIAPAIHLTKEQVGDLLEGKLGGVDKNSTHEELVSKVRDFLREKFVTANIGITGANAVAADTGSIVLVENEGNIRFTTVSPSIHIAITGVDKILPTLEYALIEAMVQAAYGSLYPPTYINVTSGPSSTGDIENKRVRPAHGPKEFHLILVDNGRFKASKEPILRDTLLCIRCGRCHFHCPIYRALGSKWGDPPYSGPMGAMWSYVLNGDGKPALLCAHSGGCKEVCPMGINIPKVLEYIKWKSLKNGNR